MPSFAKIDENNVVTEVITATYKFIRSGEVGPRSDWIECSNVDPEKPRIPSVGWVFYQDKNDFLPPKPYPSWIWGFDERYGTEYWMAPIPFPGTPENGWSGRWDEESQQWIQDPPGHFDYDLDKWVPD